MSLDAVILGVLFGCAYRLWALDKDFTRQIREHDTIFNDLQRIEKKLDYIEESLDALRNK
jgi:hypothetical protein